MAQTDAAFCKPACSTLEIAAAPRAGALIAQTAVSDLALAPASRSTQASHREER